MRVWGHARVAVAIYILNIIYFYACTYERVSLRPLQGLRNAVVDNIRRRIVSVMMRRLSKIDVSTFKYRLSPFEDRINLNIRTWYKYALINNTN